MSTPDDTSRLRVHNGELCEGTTGVFSAAEIASFTGRGLFETVSLHRGVPFALPDHLDRLEEGARRLGLPAPARDEIESGLERLVEANRTRDLPLARGRVTLCQADAPGSPVHLVIDVGPAPRHADRAKAVTLPFVRNERGALAGCKTLNYGENAVALNRAREQGADEALFANTRDDLCEGIWANLFVRVHGRWRTPSLDSGCLPGVTRARILDVAASEGIQITEERIPVTAIPRIEAAFFTSSLRGIQPVESIDRRRLPDSDTPVLESLREAWRRHVDEEIAARRDRGPIADPNA